MGNESKKIIKIVYKLGTSIADEGTLKKWVSGSNHIKIKWKYNGKPFLATFPSSPSDTNWIRASKKQISHNLTEIGFPPPWNLMQLVGAPLTKEEREIEELVENLWVWLEEE
jgi:hypothetical protein